MKTRSLGLIFIAAVIVPSILLAVLSIRAAGREEAYVEKQLAVPLDVEATHTAALANAAMAKIQDELAAGIDIPAGSGYRALLAQWQKKNPAVAVPFLLSPTYGILWPTAAAGEPETRFLAENGDFLSDKSATTVLQNIAERYSQEILKDTTTSTAPAADLKKDTAAATGPAAGSLARASEALSTGASTTVDESSVAAAPAAESASAAAPTASAAPPAATAPAATGLAAGAATSTVRQKALDAFAQSEAIQTDVYQAAAKQGDQLSSRVVQPQSRAASNAPAVLIAPATKEAEAAAPSPAPADTTPVAEADKTEKAAAPPAVATAKTAPVAPAQAAPSQYVVTSKLLSQIATSGDAGIIPRFTNSGLIFLFWEREADGRIAGCQVTGSLVRSRVAAVLDGTATASRVLTILDENGAPLAAPPGDTTRDWRRPFVSREIGPLLPRWEAAAYLASPDVITSQARTSSLVIAIMVVLLLVSVAGGGTMVLTSVYGEMRTAQKKATFVTNVSHELKTPLTSISLFIELLRGKRPVSPEKRDSYLALMAAETERLTRLINNVLDFSAGAGRKPRRYAQDALDAAEVVREIVEGQRVRLESRGFTLGLELPASGAAVRGDAEALKQVMVNLLSNAEKYSPDRKEITVRVEAAADTVLVHVLDRGLGVAERDRERIFQEFVRVDDSLTSRVQGTGLGLTIARRIARAHGGDVTCHAREGGGSDFVVRLPAQGRGGET